MLSLCEHMHFAQVVFIYFFCLVSWPEHKEETQAYVNTCTWLKSLLTFCEHMYSAQVDFDLISSLCEHMHFAQVVFDFFLVNWLEQESEYRTSVNTCPLLKLFLISYSGVSWPKQKYKYGVSVNTCTSLEIEFK